MRRLEHRLAWLRGVAALFQLLLLLLPLFGKRHIMRFPQRAFLSVYYAQCFFDVVLFDDLGCARLGIGPLVSQLLQEFSALDDSDAGTTK